MDINGIRVSTFQFGLPIRASELARGLCLLFEEETPSQALSAFLEQAEISIQKQGFFQENYGEDDKREAVLIMKLEDKEDSLLGLKIGMGCGAKEDYSERWLARQLNVKRGLSHLNMGVEISGINVGIEAYSDMVRYEVDFNEIMACVNTVTTVNMTGVEVAEKLMPDQHRRAHPFILKTFDDHLLAIGLDGPRIAMPDEEGACRDSQWQCFGARINVSEWLGSDEGSQFHDSVVNLQVYPLLNANSTMRGNHPFKDILGMFHMPVGDPTRSKMIALANQLSEALSILL